MTQSFPWISFLCSDFPLWTEFRVFTRITQGKIWFRAALTLAFCTNSSNLGRTPFLESIYRHNHYLSTLRCLLGDEFSNSHCSLRLKPHLLNCRWENYRGSLDLMERESLVTVILSIFMSWFHFKHRQDKQNGPQQSLWQKPLTRQYVFLNFNDDCLLYFLHILIVLVLKRAILAHVYIKVEYCQTIPWLQNLEIQKWTQIA